MYLKIKEMDIQTTKLELIKMLAETNDISVLQQIIQLLSPEKKNEAFWGYDAKGNHITDDMMIQMLQDAESEKENGTLKSQEDLEAENW